MIPISAFVKPPLLDSVY